MTPEWCKAVCEKSEVARFVGFFMGCYVLFTSHKTGSSLALKFSEFNPDNVKAHVLSNDALFEERA